MYAAETRHARALPGGTPLERLNSDHHELGLRVFMVIVLAHWVEHLLQAVQIYVLGWPVPGARGALGLFFPSLITSELLHYGYALVMLAGLWMLRQGFTGTLDRWKSDHDARASEGAVPATPNHVRHCVSTLVIDIDSPEQARGYMYFHVIMPHGLDHWGRYFDRYEARDGEWRFASRRVKREGGIDLLPGDPA